jgi:hypothetical protein
MVLLWFVIGILLILCIARYNESNKLFWQLFLAFILGFAATKMVTHTNSNNQSNVALTQVYPTQVSNAYTWGIISHNLGAKELYVVTAQTPVSQEYTPVLHESKITLNKTCGKVRDQPQETLTNPPEL